MAENEKALRRKPKGALGQAWGILNPYGDLWTWQTFDTPEDARRYVAEFWRNNSKVDLASFQPVRVTVRAAVKVRKESDGSYMVETDPLTGANL